MSETPTADSDPATCGVTSTDLDIADHILKFLDNTSWSCSRPVWDDDRCVWHADATDKPPEELAATIEDGKPHGAQLSGVDLSKESVLSGTRPFGVDLSEANLHRADLSEADIRGGDLSEVRLSMADLSEANLTQGVDLSEANLHSADLSDANLYGGDLSEADVQQANLSEAHLYGANLSEADLHEADLSEADLHEANLSEAHLHGADLSEANLHEANLSEAHLHGADLSEAHLHGADLSDADLHEADLSEANLQQADLSNANLSSVDLPSADLTKADLPSADLRDANLSDTNLRVADFTGAKLNSATLSGAHLFGTRFSGVFLSRGTTITGHQDRALSEVVDDPNTGQNVLDFLRPPHGPSVYDRIGRIEHELRRAYSNNGLTGQARTARVREREARRREAFAEGGTRGKLAWLWSTLAQVFTGYGIQLRWILTMMFLLYTSSAVVYWTVGGMAPIESLYYSIVTFTTSPPGPAPTGLLMRAVAGFETFAGTAAIVFLGYVLGTREQV